MPFLCFHKIIDIFIYGGCTWKWRGWMKTAVSHFCFASIGFAWIKSGFLGHPFIWIPCACPAHICVIVTLQRILLPSSILYRHSVHCQQETDKRKTLKTSSIRRTIVNKHIIAIWSLHSLLISLKSLCTTDHLWSALICSLIYNSGCHKKRRWVQSFSKIKKGGWVIMFRLFSSAVLPRTQRITSFCVSSAWHNADTETTK